MNDSELNQHMMDLQHEIMEAQEQGEQVLYFSLWQHHISHPALHYSSA